jgi:hypothetical protein
MQSKANGPGQSVVERLAAAGPSNVRGPHCWYCGKVQAWWDCDCEDVKLIKAGKKDPPRVVWRDGKMLVVLDEETIRRNQALGFKRYAPPAKSVTPVTPEPLSVTPSTVTRPKTVTPEPKESVTPRSASADRQRRYRERRAAAKAGSKKPPGGG